MDTLPPLDDEHPPSAEQIAEFRDKGHVLIPQLASEEEMAAWGPVVREVARATPSVLGEDDDLAKAFLQIQNIWTRDERARRFVFAARFARVAADLLGVDGVRIYHDQAIFKEPGSAGTPFHQDQYYFPLDGDDTITMWMPLVPVSESMGSLTYATGSHRLGFLGEFEASDESDRVFRSVIEEKGLKLETHAPMRPGDATFHPGWVLHGALGNDTPDPREVMTIIWFADGLRGIEPQHEWHQKDYDKWMPDVRPGELAAGRLNPLVWRRA